MKVLVYGGRDFMNSAALHAKLDEIHSRSPITVVVHGGARGADEAGGQWARSHGVPEAVYLPDWDGLGRRAGIVRNAQMLAANMDVNLAVECPGGRGTRDMRTRLNRVGVPQVMVEAE